MADTNYYIDTEVVGGAADGSSWANAYSSITDFVTARQGAIAAGDRILANFRGDIDALSVVLYLNLFTGDGELHLIGDSTLPHKWETGVYTLRLSTSDKPCHIGDGCTIRTQNIQIEMMRSGNQTNMFFSNTGQVTPDVYHVDTKAKFQATTNANSATHYYADASNFPNCTLDVDGLAVFGDYGYILRSSYQKVDATIRNAAVNPTTQFLLGNTGSTLVAEDSAIDTPALGNKASVTLTNCATNTGTGTNPVTVSNWASEFTDRAAGDFTLLGASQLLGAGTGNTNIGPDQVTAAGPSIVDIDGDNEVYQGQTSVTINGLNLPATVTTWSADIGGNALTASSWNSGNPIVDVPGGTPLLTNATLTLTYTE